MSSFLILAQQPNRQKHDERFKKGKTRNKIEQISIPDMLGRTPRVTALQKAPTTVGGRASMFLGRSIHTAVVAVQTAYILWT
eukprot:288866-Amphidinium_carterae.1